MSEERYLEQQINKDLKIADLERQLEEVQKENTQLKEMREHLKWKDETRKERDYLFRGIQVRDTMIKSLQDECVRLHLQIPIKPFKEQLKEQG